MSRELLPDGPSKQQGNLRIARAVTHQIAHREFVVREETVAKRAVRGQSQSIARSAKRLGDRRDEADLATSVAEAEPLGGRGSAGLCCFEWPNRRDSFKDLAAGDELGLVPLALCVQGHELDEAHDPTRVASEGGEIENLVVVDPSQDHHVDF